MFSSCNMVTSCTTSPITVMTQQLQTRTIPTVEHPLCSPQRVFFYKAHAVKKRVQQKKKKEKFVVETPLH